MADKKSFLLRISPELWAELNRWAADDLRSVNGQIEYVLRQAVAERRSWKKGRNGEGSVQGRGTTSPGE